MGLLNLPPEIWVGIERLLDDRDCRQLCKTCHALMNLVQYKAYENIVLDETSASGQGVLDLASGPRAKCVRRIQYSPGDPKPVRGWDEDEREAEHDESIKLSDETRQALASLHLFEGLVKFRFMLDDWIIRDWPVMPLGFYDHSFSNYHQSRDEEPWRILLEESLSALAESAGAFTELEIDNLPPVSDKPCYSALDTDEWRALLQPLTSLEFTLGGIPDTGAGNLTSAQQPFVDNFSKLVFSNLPNVKRLRVTANEDGYIGHYDDRYPVLWKDFEMPELTIFELDCSYFENDQLGPFILNHSDTLEEVYLRWCLAETNDDWKGLFESLLAKDVKTMVELRIVAYPVLKRSVYPDDDEWQEATQEMWKDIESKRNAENVVEWDENTTGNNDDDNDNDQEMDGAEDEEENENEEEKEEQEGEGEGSGDASEADDEDEDDDDDGEDTIERKQWYEKPRLWEKVSLDEKKRRFVVAETCESYGHVEPAELYGDPAELDESAIVEQWEKLQVIIERNRAVKGLPGLGY